MLIWLLFMSAHGTSEELLELRELNSNMQVAIALLLRLISRDNNSLPLKEQIAILNGLGVRPTEIAAIVGKKPGHVNKELVAIRRAVKR